MILKCPHCHSRMTSRTARQMSPLSVESYQRCTNFSCGFRCKVLAEIVEELKPAELRNPAVVLPVVHIKEKEIEPAHAFKGLAIPSNNKAQEIAQ
ncbi:TPA: ogr/Delta-like zinc finger family protein [Aeromonas veronii]